MSVVKSIKVLLDDLNKDRTNCTCCSYMGFLNIENEYFDCDPCHMHVDPCFCFTGTLVGVLK